MQFDVKRITKSTDSRTTWEKFRTKRVSFEQLNLAYCLINCMFHKEQWHQIQIVYVWDCDSKIIEFRRVSFKFLIYQRNVNGYKNAVSVSRQKFVFIYLQFSYFANDQEHHLTQNLYLLRNVESFFFFASIWFSFCFDQTIRLKVWISMALIIESLNRTE